jgi:hypothetical protein
MLIVCTLSDSYRFVTVIESCDLLIWGKHLFISALEPSVRIVTK